LVQKGFASEARTTCRNIVLVLRIPAADPAAAGLVQASAAALESEQVRVVAAVSVVPYQHRVVQEKARH
jgi:hypothetical protein